MEIWTKITFVIFEKKIIDYMKFVLKVTTPTTVSLLLFNGGLVNSRIMADIIPKLLLLLII